MKAILVILIGKSASGKDTILNHLIKTGWCNKLITYTTRPMRDGEVQNKSYHFITRDDFIDKISKDFFLEYKSYNSVNGEWLYGSAKEDYKDAIESKNITTVILTPSGYMDFLNKFPNVCHKSIYIYANLKTINDRLIRRGDNQNEIKRRTKKDSIDFKGVEKIVDKIIYNNSDKSVDEVSKDIINYVKLKEIEENE